MINHPLFYLIIFLISLLALDSVLAISSIRHGEATQETLKSANEKFSLGFLKFEDTPSVYLGIWYTHDMQQRKVWVANPNTPLWLRSINYATLGVDRDGVLKIIVQGRAVFNISGQASGNATATLEDSGNLRMFDETLKKTIWQSFDHPNNVLLPGMKLGYNSETKQTLSLTSWVSDSNPASGAFSLSWEPTKTRDSGQLVLYLRQKRYWESGPLENQTFKYLNTNFQGNRGELRRDNLIFVSTAVESYFSFSSNAILSMWVLNLDGSISRGSQSRSQSTYLRGSYFCYGESDSFLRYQLMARTVSRPGYESNDGCVVSVLAVNSIKHGEVTNETLKSANGKFSLGFFNIGDAASRYLGIWYSDEQQRKAWVANPNTPLSSNDSVTLGVDRYGVLKIIVHEGAVFNISDQPSGKGLNYKDLSY